MLLLKQHFKNDLIIFCNDTAVGIKCNVETANYNNNN